MKKVIIFLLVSLTYFVHSFGAMVQQKAPRIEYRLATEKDYAIVDEMYDEIEAKRPDAVANLVIFPKTVREQYVMPGLTKGKVFIAIDKAKNKVVALKKVYVIEPNELGDILQGELRFRSDGQVLFQGRATVGDEKLGDFSQRIPFKSDKLSAEEHGACCGKSICLYLYLGGAYASNEAKYKDQHLNTKLTQYALDSLKDKVLQNLTSLYTKYCASSDQSMYLAMVNGQANANVGHQLSLKPFTVFARDVLEACTGHRRDVLPVAHIAYRAYKPNFYLGSDGQLAMSPDSEKNQGQGNIYMIPC